MSVPKYRELADQIRSKIQSGELKSGDKLPSINAFVKDGWKYNTIRSAMLILETEGLIEGRPGVGVFVK